MIPPALVEKPQPVLRSWLLGKGGISVAMCKAWSAQEVGISEGTLASGLTQVTKYYPAVPGSSSSAISGSCPGRSPGRAPAPF